MASGGNIPEGFPARFSDERISGKDGFELDEPRDLTASSSQNPLTLSSTSQATIRAEIEKAGGREVCFLAEVDDVRVIQEPRAVARGNFGAVLVAARDAAMGGVMLHNHPSGALEPSDADMRIAGQLYDQGVGTVIVDNAAKHLYVVVEPPEPKERVALNPDELSDILAPGGSLSEFYEAFEDRPGQREMLEVVTHQFNQGGVAIIEAGTGTGKSLAYLLPAAYWSRNNKERTVISTNTINLQEQLTTKDLPLVRALGGDVEWALVKGRGNYVSIRRALLASDAQRSLFDDDRSDEMTALLSWLKTTTDGSLSDLPFTPEPETWEEVRSDPDICLRSRCPHFQECHYQRSRRQAASADLLIVNHHMLFTDLAVRRATLNWTASAVLPSYNRIVLDEAHNIEDAATSHLGVEVTRRELYRVLSRLEKSGRGVLSAVYDQITTGSEQERELQERIETRVRPALAQARLEVEGFIDTVEELLPSDKSTVRIGSSGVGELAERDEVGEQLSASLNALATLERELSELGARIELDENISDGLEGRLLDLRAITRRLAAARHGLGLVFTPGEKAGRYVRWLELRGRGRRSNLVMAAAPIDLGDLLVESLFSRVETTILTSATLATRKNFSFLRKRIGLHKEQLDRYNLDCDVNDHIILSPFNFQDQTILAVPTDLPAAEEGSGEFYKAIAEVTEQVATLSDGGLFVLFTSYAALIQVGELLRLIGADSRWPLFIQGEDDRHRLLQRFVEHGRGILLGTASFWEGVDVPGDPLRGLIIQKLPFKVPTEPVTAARMEAIQRAGQDGFQEYMLPHAALRLKQGVGRLIRSKSDRGAVVLLDDRLVTKQYGHYLRNSLPGPTLVKGAWSDVQRRLKAFYSQV
ncbi:MAG: DEAD/DEAH box helicase family protein [Gemmatimonadetes bacterium]|nr:DEAD/DEAH box helicase family protein [Gemmatimonadota bacterium]